MVVAVVIRYGTNNRKMIMWPVLLCLHGLSLVSSFVIPTTPTSEGPVGLARPARPHLFRPLSYSNDEEASNADKPTLTSSRESTWQNAVSVESDAMESLDELLDNVHDADEADIGFLFLSQFHGSAFPAVVKEANKRLKNCRILSVVGSGVIGKDKELDEPTKPSMSLLLGSNIAHDAMEVFDFNELENPPPSSSSEYWDHLRGRENNDDDDENDESSSYLIFADPWSPVEKVFDGLGPRAVVAGGISVPTGTGPTVAKDGNALPQGSLVGVRFSRALHLQVVTAQGCRPVPDSPPMTITEAEGSCILELDGKPAIEVLESLVSQSPDPLTGLVCGIQACDASIEIEGDDMCEASTDYLIRQIVGFVPTKGGIAVAGGVHIGDRLLFHVRDKDAAQQDLDLMLQRARTEQTVFGYQGKLVCAFQFSCIARGRSFFGEVNVDLNQTKSILPDDQSPVAGFYANGELGPVGIAGFTRDESSSSNHIHGFTTLMAYLCDTTSTVATDLELEPVLSPLADDPVAWG